MNERNEKRDKKRAKVQEQKAKAQQELVASWLIREEEARIAQEKENDRLIKEWQADFSLQRVWFEGKALRFLKSLETDKEFR